MQTFSKNTQYIPSLEQVQGFFMDNGLTAAHGTGWYNQMQNNAWLDKKGNKIMYWQKFARFKLDDFKRPNPINEPAPPKIIKDSAKGILLPPELKFLSESIVDLYQVKTGMINSATLKVTAELIQTFQQSLKVPDKECHSELLKLLGRIINKQGFTYDNLIADFSKEIKFLCQGCSTQQ